MKIKKFKIAVAEKIINGWMASVDVIKVTATNKFIVITYKETKRSCDFNIKDKK